MAEDIIFKKSPNELEKELKAIYEKDQRALPHRAKVFSAIAKLQKFDVLPELGTPDEFDAAIKKGYKELQRGISATKGMPSLFYATELVRGAMYPGTLSAIGNGMYFATPSQQQQKPGEHPAFPKVSLIAMKYTKSADGAGLLRRSNFFSVN